MEPGLFHRRGYALIEGGSAKVSRTGGPLKGDIKGEYDTHYIRALNLNFVYRFRPFKAAPGRSSGAASASCDRAERNNTPPQTSVVAATTLKLNA